MATVSSMAHGTWPSHDALGRTAEKGFCFTGQSGIICRISAVYLIKGRSAQGQKRRFDPLPAPSGLLRTTDIIRPARQVRLVPTTDSCTAAVSSFDHLIGTSKKGRRNFEIERLCCFDIYDQQKLRRLFHRQIRCLGPFQYLVHVTGCAVE